MAEQLPGVEWVADHVAVAAIEAVSGPKREYKLEIRC